MKKLESFMAKGYAGPVIAATLAVAAICFLISFVASCTDVEFRKAKKSFFLWISAFAETVIIGACRLDRAAGGIFSQMQAALIPVCSAAALLTQYAVLALQRAYNPRVAAQNNENARFAPPEKGYVPPEKSYVPPEKSYVPHEANGFGVGNAEHVAAISQRVAFIEEVPARARTMRMASAAPFETLCETYLYDTIERLKNCPLEESDAEILRRAEQNLRPLKGREEDKRELSQNLGRIVTLMAKYI